MSIIWNDIDECHDIQPKGALRAKLDKYFVDGKLPNKNVTTPQAEAVIQDQINAEILQDGVHLYIHIESFPKMTEEETPFIYCLWLGELGVEPPPNWWEFEPIGPIE